MGNEEATRGTWKGHGKPATLRYYGRSAIPTTGFDLVTVEADATPGIIVITDQRTGHVERVGAATRIWAAPRITPDIPVDQAPVVIRDAAQDALDAEQERTGVHAACGLKITDHCDRCDECPRTPGPCWCMATDDDRPVVIVEGSTAPGFTIPFGPEITGDAETLASVDRITADIAAPWDDRLISGMEALFDGLKRHPITSEDAAMLSGEPMPLVITHPVTIDRPLTVADVVDLVTPEEAVTANLLRERRWDRRRKVTSGRRVSGRKGR